MSPRAQARRRRSARAAAAAIYMLLGTFGIHSTRSSVLTRRAPPQTSARPRALSRGRCHRGRCGRYTGATVNFFTAHTCCACRWETSVDLQRHVRRPPPHCQTTAPLRPGRPHWHWRQQQSCRLTTQQLAGPEVSCAVGESHETNARARVVSNRASAASSVGARFARGHAAHAALHARVGGCDNARARLC